MAKTICQKTAPNFETLRRAFHEGQVCLLEARRRSDGRVVALLCAVNHEPDGGGEFVPLAEMTQGNPYEQYDPPLTEGGFHEA